MAHYDTHSQTGPSPLIRGLRKHIRNSVLPSNSVSNTSDEGVSTPDALRPSSRAAEAKKLREEALRLQEKQEEQELKLRRKVYHVTWECMSCDLSVTRLPSSDYWISLVSMMGVGEVGGVAAREEVQ